MSGATMTRSSPGRCLRRVHIHVGGVAARMLLALAWLLSIMQPLPAVEGEAQPRPATAADPANADALAEEDVVQKDLNRLIGRWERTVPNSKPPMRELLTIEEDHDTLDVLNKEGELIRRYTSRFKLERAGDVRIYNRSESKLVKGQAPLNSVAQTHSFAVQFTKGGFFEVSGMLHGRDASRPRHVSILWKKAGAVARDDQPDDDAAVEAAEDDTPEMQVVEPPADADKDPDLKRDLALLQGSWEISDKDAQGNVVWSSEKLIEGNTERLIRYDGEGKVTYEHTVKFRLEKYGPVRVFDFYDMSIVTGPGAGNVDTDHYAFLYKVDDDRFFDCPGTFVSRSSYRNEPRITVWRRPQRTEEVDAILEIEKLGGTVSLDDEGRTIISLTGKNFGDEHLRLLKEFKKLHELLLVDSRVTDAGLKEVTRVASLARLNLKQTAIGDAGLQEIARLENLEILVLISTKVTDAGLANLIGLKRLRQLLLGQTNITDKGIREIVQLKDLVYLGLMGTKVSDAGVKELSELGHLTTLFLGGPDITDASVKQLVKLKNLTQLGLGQSPISDAEFKEIKAALPNTNVHR